jgi:hypothetical protein
MAGEKEEENLTANDSRPPNCFLELPFPGDRMQACVATCHIFRFRMTGDFANKDGILAAA